MKPLVSPEIAYVPYRLARAGSRRRLVRRHSRLREAITEDRSAPAPCDTEAGGKQSDRAPQCY